MTPDGEKTVIALLSSINDGIQELISLSKKRTAATLGLAVADDRDLDSQYGDEEVKSDPRDWSGKKYKGATMSRCPPDYLDMLAQMFDYFAQKNDEKKAVDTKGNPKSKYDRRSAARARGWAARIRAGWKPYVAQPADDGLKSGFPGDGDGYGGKGDAFEAPEDDSSALDNAGF